MEVIERISRLENNHKQLREIVLTELERGKVYDRKLNSLSVNSIRQEHSIVSLNRSVENLHAITQKLRQNSSNPSQPTLQPNRTQRISSHQDERFEIRAERTIQPYKIGAQATIQSCDNICAQQAIELEEIVLDGQQAGMQQPNIMFLILVFGSDHKDKCKTHNFD